MISLKSVLTITAISICSSGFFSSTAVAQVEAVYEGSSQNRIYQNNREQNKDMNSYRKAIRGEVKRKELSKKDAFRLYPKLSKMFQEVAERLTKAQADVINADPKNPYVRRIRTRIYLTLDEVVDAGAIVLPNLLHSIHKQAIQTGYIEMENAVVMSSGLLRQMLKTPADFDKIVAILAHELAHNLDYVLVNLSVSLRALSPEFESVYGPTQGELIKKMLQIDSIEIKQAQEYLADGFAKEILRKAGFDPATLYQALQELDRMLPPEHVEKSSHTDNSKKIGRAFIATHPEDRMRDVANRVKVTFDRYEKGSVRLLPLKQSFPNSEILVVGRPVDTLFVFDPNRQFQSIQEGTNLLLNFMDRWKVNQGSVRHVVNQISFNRAWTKLDDLVFEILKTRDLSQEEAAAFAKVNVRYLVTHALKNSGSQFGYYWTPPLIDLFQYDENGRMVKLAERRSTMMNATRLANDLHYARSVAVELKNDWRNLIDATPDWGDGSSLFDDLKRILPAGKIVSTLDQGVGYRQLLMQRFDRLYGISTQTTDSKRFIFLNEKHLSPFPWQDRIQLLDYFLQELIPFQQNTYHSIGLLLTASIDSLFPIIYQGRNRLSASVVLKPEVQSVLNRLYARLWKAKEELAIAELFLPGDTRVDWDGIFSSVGVTRSEGIRQIQEGLIKGFTSSQIADRWAYGVKSMGAQQVQMYLNGTNVSATTGDIYSSRLSHRALLGENPKKIIWYHENLMPYFSGEQSARLSETNALVLKRLLKTKLYVNRPDEFRRDFKAAFLRYASSQPLGRMSAQSVLSFRALAIRDLIQIQLSQLKSQQLLTEDEKNFLLRLHSWGTRYVDADLPFVDDICLEWIDQQALPSELKTKWILAFLDLSPPAAPLPFGSHWLSSTNSMQIYRLMLKQNLLDPKKTIPTLLKVDDRRKLYRNGKKAIIAWLEHAANDDQSFLELCKQLWPATLKGSSIREAAAAEIKAKVVQLIEKGHLPVADRLLILKLMSHDGSLKIIDQAVLRAIRTTHSPDDLRAFAYGRFELNQNAFEFGSRFFELKYGKDVLAPSLLSSVAEEVQSVLPVASAARDRLIEKLAWQSPAARTPDLQKLENLKTYSIVLPEQVGLWVRVSSSISTFVQTLNESQINALIQHVVSRSGEPLDPSLRASIRRSLLGNIQVVQSMRAQLEEAYEWFTKSELKTSADLTDDVLDWADHFFSGMSGNERVPIIDLLINSGLKPISQNQNYEIMFMRQFLGYQEGSQDEKVLRAFLLASEQHERSVVLAYLASLERLEGKAPLMSLFDVFKTPGKKAAQAAHTFKLLGDRSGELRESKSSKTASMSKYRILQIIENEQGAAFNGVLLNQFIAAASLKSVALATRPDLQKIAIAVIDPLAIDQSRSHFEFGKRFLAELEKEGMSMESNLLKSLLSAFELQIERESETAYEVQAYEKASVAIEKLNTKDPVNVGAWKLRVPSLDQKLKPTAHVMAMELVDGVPFDQLTEAEKRIAGRSFVEKLVQLLFEEGIWEGDRHLDNQFFNRRNGTISLIDWGQFEQFKKRVRFLPDDRTQIARLLYGVAKKDAAFLAQTISEISKNGSSQQQKIKLAEKIEEVFSKEQSQQDMMIDLYKAFYQAGFEVEDRFSVGFLKGLITLIGEGYADEAALREILSSAVSKELRSRGLWFKVAEFKALRLKEPDASFIDCVLIMKRRSTKL